MNKHTLYSWRPEQGGETLQEQYIPLRPIEANSLTKTDWSGLKWAFLHSGQQHPAGSVGWEITKPQDSALTVYLIGPGSPWQKLEWAHLTWWYRFCFENYRKEQLQLDCGVRVKEIDGGNTPEWFVEVGCLDWTPEQIDKTIVAVLRWHSQEGARIGHVAREQYSEPLEDYPGLTCE